MTRYSLHIKGDKEAIIVKKASSLDEATEIFTRIKNLSREKFDKLYEVTER